MRKVLVVTLTAGLLFGSIGFAGKGTKTFNVEKQSCTSNK